MSLILMAVTAVVCYMIQGALYERFWKKGLSATVVFLESEAVCKETAHLRETVINRKFLPISVLRLKFKVGRNLVFSSSEHAAVTDYAYRNDVFSLLPYQKVVRTTAFTCQKRGYYTIDQLELVSHDLFFSRLMIDIVDQHTRFYVYPSSADVSRLNVPFQKLLGTLLSVSQLCRDPFEFQTIREYGPGDSLRDVNWKVTAHTGELKVNVYEPTASQNVYLLLNLESGYALHCEEEEEESICICGTLLRELTERGIQVGIVSNGIDQISGTSMYLEAGAGAGHIKQAMEGLARLDTSLPMEAFHRLLEHAQARLFMEQALYVMISSCQREETQAAFQSYACCSPGSVWIVPLCRKDPLIAGPCKSAEIIRWEVPYDKV